MPTNPYQELIGDFLLDTRDRVSRIEEAALTLGAASDDDRGELVDRIKRELHTLKGNSGMMGFTELQTLAHEFEDEVKASGGEGVDVVRVLHFLDSFRAGLDNLTGESPEKGEGATPGGEPESKDALATDSVRVPFAALDALIDRIAEMVIFRNRLSDEMKRGRGLDRTSADYDARSVEAWSDAQLAFEALGGTLDFLRDRVMRLRMVPLRSLFGSLERMVFDEARREEKEVRLETSGGETSLDKALLELANETLGHLVRNAVIHGIERPDVRAAAGKPRQGTVRVAATASGDEIQIVVADDGGGIDADAVARAAAREGIDVSSLEDGHAALYVPGVSTRESADIGAGRGMGMSAVQEAVRRQGGRIDIDSKVGRGTSFQLNLPLSVSITRALLVEADGEAYALPLSAVVDTQRLAAGDGHQLNQAGVLRWRDETIALLDLGCGFGTAEALRQTGAVIVIEAGSRHRGLLADKIDGIREIVVRGLDPVVGAPPGIAGSTILGDGRAILILDPRGLVDIQPFVEAPS